MGMIKLLFSFRGRIDRPLYWAGGVSVTVVSFIAYYATLAPLLSPGPGAKAIASLGLPGLLVCLWCGMALNVKRLHDRGRSGWLALVLLGPLLAVVNYIRGDIALGSSFEGLMIALDIATGVTGAIFAVDLGMLDGQPGPNRFGYPHGMAPPEDAPLEPDEFHIAMAKAGFARILYAFGLAKSAAASMSSSLPAKTPVSIPGVTAKPAPAPSFSNVEAAMERAIAAHKQGPQHEAPTPKPGAKAQQTPQAGGLKPASARQPTPPQNGASSFGRRAPR